jgi:hypothetical protein
MQNNLIGINKFIAVVRLNSAINLIENYFDLYNPTGHLEDKTIRISINILRLQLPEYDFYTFGTKQQFPGQLIPIPDSFIPENKQFVIAIHKSLDRGSREQLNKLARHYCQLRLERFFNESIKWNFKNLSPYKDFQFIPLPDLLPQPEELTDAGCPIEEPAGPPPELSEPFDYSSESSSSTKVLSSESTSSQTSSSTSSSSGSTCSSSSSSSTSSSSTSSSSSSSDSTSSSSSSSDSTNLSTSSSSSSADDQLRALGWTESPFVDHAGRTKWHKLSDGTETPSGGNGTWDTIAGIARSYGGYMASVHSQEENDYLRDLADTVYGDSGDIWLGLNLQFPGNPTAEEWAWHDWSDTNYFNWDDGQPEDKGETVIKMNSFAVNGGKWHDHSRNDSERGMMQVVVEEFNKNNKSLIDNGWMPSPFTDEQGRYKWFKLTASSVYWDEGRTEAQSFGGELASIHSGAENSFIKAMNPNPLWIGFNDRAGPNNNFVWSDGSPVNWPPPWDGGEPNNSGGNETVVELRSNSKWNDLESNFPPGSGNKRIAVMQVTAEEFIPPP